jgi:hypothetical protein
LPTVYPALTDSFATYSLNVTSDIFPQEVQVPGSIPKTIKTALSPPFQQEWIPAVDKEIAGFIKHDCFKAVPFLPKNVSCLPGIWVFSRKRDNTGYTAKARFCIGGHLQTLGLDYFQNKTYCAVLSSRDNRMLLSLAASEGWQVYQTDIVQAFLYGKLDDAEIYIKPPARYPCPDGWMLLLLKAIYGLHQAPVKFNKEVVAWFKGHTYLPANDAQTVWILRVKLPGRPDQIIIHALYADDFIHLTNDTALYKAFQKAFNKKFEVKTGNVTVYLGNKVSINPVKLSVTLDQTHYIMELLERFKMSDSTSVATPMVNSLTVSNSGETLSIDEHTVYRYIVGCLLYLACWTRPDISFSVSELSRFVAAPCEAHLVAAKHVLRYLRGTPDLGLTYSKSLSQGSQNQLYGFVDSDWAGCHDTRRSTSGYTLMLNGAAVSWKSKLQTVVALSTAEAEFVAASSMVQEVIYARKFLDNLGFPQTVPTQVFEDNSTCIAWSEGSVGGSDRAKHIDLREHFVHDAVKEDVLKLVVVASTDNVADILTKPLSKAPFQLLRKRIMGL